MPLSTTALIALLVIISLMLATAVAWRAAHMRAPVDQVLTFGALILLPGFAMWASFTQHMASSETTRFCLSCHVMHNYGKSLYINDPSFIPAKHFQNHWVPQNKACFTCHTDYTMFGDYRAKLRGLRHVYVEYFGKVPSPNKIKLYTPYNNRECLHCHAGARNFEEAKGHHKKPGMMAAIQANRLSCLNSNCHEFIHDRTGIAQDPIWKGAAADAAANGLPKGVWK